MAKPLFRGVPEDDEEDEDDQTDDEEEDEDAEEEDGGYSECRVSESTHYTQADFFGDRRNSITLPMCCGPHPSVLMLPCKSMSLPFPPALTADGIGQPEFPQKCLAHRT